MFHGSIPALITPFKNGAIDRDAFANLIELQIAGGSAALVPCGTTGESATLSHDEHKQVVELCIQVARGRVPVIAGAGSNSTKEAIELTEHAKQVGADAALVICPYYNKPDQAGLEAHFRAINDAVSMPIVMYNVPGRTASDLLPETLGRLAQLPNIIGIKDASNDLGRVSLTTVLSRSSNVGSTKVAMSLEPDQLWQTMTRFGFGSLTSSGFPGESAGLLTHYNDWRQISQATLGYGYGVSVTPLQLAQAYAALGSDVEIRPVSLVRLDEANDGRKVIIPETAEAVLLMME